MTKVGNIICWKFGGRWPKVVEVGRKLGGRLVTRLVAVVFAEAGSRAEGGGSVIENTELRTPTVSSFFPRNDLGVYGNR